MVKYNLECWEYDLIRGSGVVANLMWVEQIITPEQVAFSNFEWIIKFTLSEKKEI